MYVLEVHRGTESSKLQVLHAGQMLQGVHRMLPRHGSRQYVFLCFLSLIAFHRVNGVAKQVVFIVLLTNFHTENISGLPLQISANSLSRVHFKAEQEIFM